MNSIYLALKNIVILDIKFTKKINLKIKKMKKLTQQMHQLTLVLGNRAYAYGYEENLLL